MIQCVSMVSINFVINGEKRIKLSPFHGLRQCDPLSLYLFLFVQEVLSGMISKEIVHKRLVGVKLRGSCLTISHLFFADDSLVFPKASTCNCERLLSALDVFCEALGMSINYLN